MEGGRGQFHGLKWRGKRGESSGIEEGEEGVGWGGWDHAGAAVQGERVITVSVPAGGTDAVVHISTTDALQSEDMKGRERVALPSAGPLVTPLAASKDRTVMLHARHRI